jgi:hypothetical protein
MARPEDVKETSSSLLIPDRPLRCNIGDQALNAGDPALDAIKSLLDVTKALIDHPDQHTNRSLQALVSPNILRFLFIISCPRHMGTDYDRRSAAACGAGRAGNRGPC